MTLCLKSYKRDSLLPQIITVYHIVMHEIECSIEATADHYKQRGFDHM